MDLKELLGIIPGGDIIQKYQEEYAAEAKRLKEEWKAKESVGSSPNGELVITMLGTSVVTKVTIDPSVDTSNKTLMEMLFMVGMNNAIKAFQDNYAAYTQSLVKAEDDMVIRLKLEIDNRDAVENGEEPDPAALPDNVLNFNIVNNNKKTVKKD